jgi:hypothetical protein
MTDPADSTPASDGPPINHVALWAMITGIAGWVFFFTPTPFALVAVVLGHIGLVQTRGQSGQNRAFAVVGIVLGYSGIAFFALSLLASLAIVMPILGMLFGGVIVP